MTTTARSMSTRNRLRAFVAAAAVSGLGDWLYVTGLPIVVFARTGDPFAVALLATARLVPFLLLSAPAGILADRTAGPRLVVSCEVTRMAAMLVLAALTAVAAPVLAIGLAAVVSATLGTCSGPATRRLMSELAADPRELLGANAASASLDGVACLVGPAVAGILAVANLLPLAFALNGLSFGVVALAAVLAADGVRESPDGRSGAAPAAVSVDAATARRRPSSTLVPALLLDAAISFASAALGVLTILVAVELLRMDGAFAAVLGTAAGAGGIVGGLGAGALATNAIERPIAGGIAIATGSVVVLALAGAPLVAGVAMAGSAGALVLLETLNVTRLQVETRDGGTGRAFGLLHTTAAAAMLAGAIVPGVAAAFAGIQVALLLVAVVVAALGAGSLGWSHLEAAVGPSGRVAVRELGVAR